MKAKTYEVGNRKRDKFKRLLFGVPCKICGKKYLTIPVQTYWVSYWRQRRGKLCVDCHDLLLRAEIYTKEMKRDLKWKDRKWMRKR